MSYKFINIHNDLKGYNQLVKFYVKHKDDLFENFEIELIQWFDANLSAFMGAIFDKIKNNGLNNIKFINIYNDIQTILQKNGFLSFYEYERIYDTYQSTIEYKKLKPQDGRYFNNYLEKELLDLLQNSTCDPHPPIKINQATNKIYS